jgi:GT2 family glycosyltransferase
MLDLSIITVGTNEKHWLKPCLESVYSQTRGVTFEVIVVDNASKDGTSEMLASEFPQVKIVRNDHNLGFAAANNKAIRLSAGKMVLLLNPDTVVLDGAIQKTITFMKNHPKAGLVGCKLKYPDGRFQPTAYAFPTLWNMFVEAIFLYKLFPKTKIFGGYHLTYLDYNKDVQVDWLIGAYFLIQREVIERVGILDEQFFMYTEDTDFCYRIKKAGYEVWFTSGAEITHFYGGISGITRRVVIWTHRSQILFYQKHYGTPQRQLLYLIKLLNLLLRVPWYIIEGIVTVNRRGFKKSLYAAYSFWKILVNRWHYIPGYTGEVTSWASE